ncbi:uncharacterized protein LOC115254423 [Aedes albopictus]|uniref:GIY-YIG domain-containing protein n=1 Tax=Aedes albopictus TaxID=7160 RepID=A0ABM1YNG7_AEDAL
MEDLLESVIKKLKFNNTLEAFNQYNNHLQFTIEMEKDGTLLHTIVIRHNDQSVTTKWTTATSTTAKHPNVNTATTIPAVPATSATGDIAFNFTANATATKHHKSTTEQHQTNSSQQDHQHQATEVLYRSLPNIPTLIRTISNILKKDYNQVEIATRNIKTTKSLLKPIKDPVPPNDQHNVVYSTPCNNCEGVYIGMTTNQLKKRMSGHNSDVNKIVNTPTNITPAKTALTQHMIEHNHTFNLDGTKIVDRTFRSTALPILEMCHIQNTYRNLGFYGTINFRTDVDGLNTAYAGILHTIKTTNSRREQLKNSTHNTHH